MKNFVQSGRVLSMIAPAGGVTSGVGVLIGSLFGIASTTVAAGGSFELERFGSYDHASDTGTAWAAGDIVYWDNVNKRFTKTAGGNTKAGCAAEDKQAATAIGRVVLIPAI